jgi:hypothetical protein
MKEDVAQYTRGCILCCANKPSNKNQGLNHPLLIPTRPWEIISMDFVGTLLTIRKGHDYLFVVVENFNKMFIIMPCKKTTKGQEATNIFFEHIWLHFRIPRSIISNMDTIFLTRFWTTLWENMDTMLKRSIAFHPKTNGKIEVVKKTLLHILRGYN